MNGGCWRSGIEAWEVEVFCVEDAESLEMEISWEGGCRGRGDEVVVKVARWRR